MLHSFAIVALMACVTSPSWNMFPPSFSLSVRQFDSEKRLSGERRTSFYVRPPLSAPTIIHD